MAAQKKKGVAPTGSRKKFIFGNVDVFDEDHDERMSTRYESNYKVAHHRDVKVKGQINKKAYLITYSTHHK